MKMILSLRVKILLIEVRWLVNPLQKLRKTTMKPNYSILKQPSWAKYQRKQFIGLKIPKLGKRIWVKLKMVSKRVWESIITEKEMYILESGWMIKWQGKEPISSKIVILTLEKYTKEWSMGMADISIGMGMFMKENGWMI